MAKKSKGWQKRAITRSSGEKTDLETLPGYYIIPKKLSLDVMQQITDSQGIDIDSDSLKGKSEDEIKEAIEKAYQKRSGKKFSLSDEGFQNMLKLAFLYGVHDHNFDAVVDKDGKRIPVAALDAMSDKDFEFKIENGDLINGKIIWNENLYVEMRSYTETLFEIFKIVMAFNRPLQRETSEKSET
jgi:hypothetical protein